MLLDLIKGGGGSGGWDRDVVISIRCFPLITRVFIFLFMLELFSKRTKYIDFDLYNY